MHNFQNKKLNIYSDVLGEILNGQKTVTAVTADLSHAEALAKIRNESRQTQIDYGVYSWAEKKFDDVVSYYTDKIEEGGYIVATVDSRAIGMFGLSKVAPSDWQDLQTDSALYFERLALLREFRGSGLARMLLEHAKSISLREGFKKLRLDCPASSGLVEYYKKFGFLEFGSPLAKRPSGYVPQLMEVDLV